MNRDLLAAYSVQIFRCANQTYILNRSGSIEWSAGTRLLHAPSLGFSLAFAGIFSRLDIHLKDLS